MSLEFVLVVESTDFSPEPYKGERHEQQLSPGSFVEAKPQLCLQSDSPMKP